AYALTNKNWDIVVSMLLHIQQVKDINYTDLKRLQLFKKEIVKAIDRNWDSLDRTEQNYIKKLENKLFDNPIVKTHSGIRFFEGRDKVLQQLHQPAIHSEPSRSVKHG